MNTPLDVLRQDHWVLSKLLTDLEHQATGRKQVLRTDWWTVLRTLNNIIQYPDQGHHRMEDILCENLRSKHWTSDLVIDVVEKDHGELDVQESKLKGIVHRAMCVNVKSQTSDVLESIHAYINHYRQHIEIEDDVLFPMIHQHNVADQFLLDNKNNLTKIHSLGL